MSFGENTRVRHLSLSGGVSSWESLTVEGDMHTQSSPHPVCLFDPQKVTVKGDLIVSDDIRTKSTLEDMKKCVRGDVYIGKMKV